MVRGKQSARSIVRQRKQPRSHRHPRWPPGLYSSMKCRSQNNSASSMTRPGATSLARGFSNGPVTSASSAASPIAKKYGCTRSTIQRGSIGRARSSRWQSSSGTTARWAVVETSDCIAVRTWRAAGGIKVVLGVAHLNHTPGDDRDENLKALCQWCHLNYDKIHHRETRAARKDKARPLLAMEA